MSATIRPPIDSPSSRDAIGLPEFLLDVGAKGIEVADRVGDDDAIATIASRGDHPAFVEEGFVGEIFGEEVGHEGATGFAEAMGEQQHTLVPMDGPGQGEFRHRRFRRFRE